MRLAAVALLLCVAGCTTRVLPQRGVVRVAIGPSLDGVHAWREDQLAMIGPYLSRELDGLGYDFQLVSEGSADVVVRASDLGRRSKGACGEFTAGLAYVEVDAACARGYEALKRAVGHELLHWLTWREWRWVGHLCSWPLNTPVPPRCHPEIPCIDCLLSPGLTMPDDGPEFHEVYLPPVAEPSPADRDYDLFERCATHSFCQ